MGTSFELISAVEEILDAHVLAGGIALAEHKETDGDKDNPTSVVIKYHYRSSLGSSFIASIYYTPDNGGSKVAFVHLEVAFGRPPEKDRGRLYAEILSLNRSSSFGEALLLIENNILGMGWRQQVDHLNLDFLKVVLERFVASAEDAYRILRVNHDIRRFYPESSKITTEEKPEGNPEEKDNITRLRQKNLG